MTIELQRREREKEEERERKEREKRESALLKREREVKSIKGHCSIHNKKHLPKLPLAFWGMTPSF